MGAKALTKVGLTMDLSEAAVRVRVQRLIADGALQIVGVADPRVFGLNIRAIIGVSVVGDTTRVAETLSELSELVHIVTTAGRFDLILEAVVADEQSLSHLVNRQIRTIKGVQSTETWIIFRTHKENYFWGSK